MNPNKALWEKGDFTEIAAFMRRSGEAVVKSIVMLGDRAATENPRIVVRDEFVADAVPRT